MDYAIIARVIHVAAVVVWIGGVAMATTVFLPLVRRRDRPLNERFALFESVERRFIWQARTATILVMLSGFYMVAHYDLWSRFSSAEFWWMDAMVAVWLIFTLLLFVGEPLVLHRYFPPWARRDPERAFAALHRVHVVLLALAIMTILGAMAGSHGWLLF